MDKLKMHTLDKVDDNIEKIAALFPNALTEVIKDGIVTHTIDFDVLRQELSNVVVDGIQERYQFTWPDKRKSILLANAPIAKTLRPCREESVDFDTTQNLYIEGDNLDALKLLQETYLGKVKMIYIDPPYNTGNDFVYEDDFSQGVDEYMAGSGQFDEAGGRLVTNLDSNGRFHTDWLNMIYPRLKLAKDLLTNDGVIFISIDDNEMGNIIKLASEVFGVRNIIACFPRVTKKAGKTTEAIAKNNDYVVMCSKGLHPNIILPYHTDEDFKFDDEYLEKRGKYKLNQTLDYDSLQYSTSLDYPIEIDGMTIYPGQSHEKYLDRQKGNHARADWAWRWSKELFEFGLKNGFVVVKKYSDYARIYTKTYQNAAIKKTSNGYVVEYIDRTRSISTLEFIENEFSNDNSKKNLLQVFETSVFDYSKPVSLLKALVQMSSTQEDIILDFFSGSATTAHAVLQLNAEDGGHRKFIMVQLPEETDEKSEAYKAGYKNICEIGKERIRRAGRKIKDDAGLMAQDLDIGFRVLKIDSTNMQDVYYNPVEIQQLMLGELADNIKADRTGEDLLVQVMLDLGVLLSSKIEEIVIGGKKVFSVADSYLIACFDSAVTTEVVTEIAKMKPYYAVFRDSGMANDSVATNFEQVFATYSPSTVRKVL